MKHFTQMLCALLFGALFLHAEMPVPALAPAVVPNADFIMVCNGSSLDNNKFIAECNKISKELEKDQVTKEMTKEIKAMREFATAIGIDPDDPRSCDLVFTVALNDMDFNAPNPDLTKLDICGGFVPRTQINIKALPTAGKKLKESIASNGEGFTVTPGIYGKAITANITITDEGTPEPLRKWTVATLDAGKVIYFGLEKSVKAAIDRAAASQKTPIAADINPNLPAYASDFAMLFRLNAQMQKELQAYAEMDPTMASLKNLKAAGFTLKFSDDAMTMATIAKTPDAQKVKAELWDGMASTVIPVLQEGAATSGINCLKTLTCTANDEFVTITMKITLDDVKALIELAKQTAAEPAAAAPAAAPAAK